MISKSFLAAGEARVVMAGLFFAIGFSLESIFPLFKISTRHRVFNCLCGTIYQLSDLATSLSIGVILSSLSKRPLISLEIRDHNRLVFALILAFVWVASRDFFYYWFHRRQHSSKLLWAEHALHHSDENMNVTTALRHHWLETPLNAIFVTAPMVLLFKPPLVTIPMAYLVMYSVSYLIHSGVRLNAGFLAKIVATPQTHRIHHSRQAEHIDVNFAQFLPLWDILFGTFYLPQKDEFPRTGLTDGETVTSVEKAVLMPFRIWLSMLRAPAKALIEGDEP